MKPRSKPLRRWLLYGTILIALIGVYLLSSPAPDDTVRVMSIGGRYNQINRHVIGPKATDHGISLKGSQLPCSVTFQTNGHQVRVYLLDLSSIDSSIDKVKTYMTASDEIARGQEPTTSTVVHRAVRMTDGIFQLPAWPWTWHADYMLIAYADVETQLILRVSYGK